MKIGIFGSSGGRQLLGDALVEDARASAAAGFHSYWLPSQRMGPDPLVSLALIGQQVPKIELGVAVRPTWPQHPLVLAQQALTIAYSVPDRFSLGVGVSHPAIVSSWGYEFDHPVTRTEEYLKLLGQALRNEPSSFEGKFISGSGPQILPDLAGGQPPKLYLGALGAKMLNLVGALANGTILWMTGPRTIRDFTRPTLDAAAKAAGRPAPRIVVAIPVLCTEDPTAGRLLAAQQFRLQPSYRAMLDREGLSGPEELAIVGNQETVARRFKEIFDAGADEIICTEFGTDADLAQTRSCLEDLVRG
jgi:5,10-methylenetetrahydromethanopterin reductase